MLLEQWTGEVAAGPEGVAAGRDLLGRWAEPHRRYHDTRHLAEVLTALRRLAAPVPAEVVCAAWFHDAVYIGAAGDEQRSADLAARTLTRLGWPGWAVEEVVRLVLLTTAHDPADDDVPGALLCDADLAVLAAPPERYREYVADVRAEYGHLSDDAFRAGRAAVLQALAGRARLFTTPAGRQAWEAAARRNLQAELAALGAAPPP